MSDLDFLEYKQYLAHYGIKGQRHGVRRFQNEDGSLTAAGEQRYLRYNKGERPTDSSYSTDGRVRSWVYPEHPNSDQHPDYKYGNYKSSRPGVKQKPTVSKTYYDMPTKVSSSDDRKLRRVISSKSSAKKYEDMAGATRKTINAVKDQFKNSTKFSSKEEEDRWSKDFDAGVEASSRVIGNINKKKNDKAIARRTAKNKVKNAVDKAVYDTKKSVKGKVSKAASSAKDKVAKGKAKIMKLFSK